LDGGRSGTGIRLATAIHIVVFVSDVFVPASTAIELVPPIITGIKLIVAIPAIDDVFAPVWAYPIVTATPVDDVIARSSPDIV
jgi:hypothetical protein